MHISAHATRSVVAFGYFFRGIVVLPTGVPSPESGESVP